MGEIMYFEIINSILNGKCWKGGISEKKYKIHKQIYEYIIK